MATWDNVVYTTLGLNLMAKLQTGATLEITRAVGGDGHVSADALPALTEIIAKQTLTLSDAIYKGNGQALLPVTLYNRGLTEGYPLRQIGIYATDPDDGEVLMLVAQSEQPDTIPSAEDSPDFVANFSFHIALGNAGRINVSYSLTDMATKADYVAYVEQIEGRLGQPSGIATLDSNGKLAQMPTAADVGAVPSESTIRLRVTGDDAVPHYADANDYKIPGQRISISPQVTAASVDNLPETNSGQLCVYGFDSNSIYQIYETFWGTRWIRQYTISTGAWGTWMGGRPKSITIPGVAGAITSEYVGWAYKNPFGEVNLGIWADLSAPVNSSTFRAIGTLPEGYRPSAYETIETTIELRGSSSGLEAGIVSIGSNGKIQVARAVGSNSSGLNMVRGQVNFYVG